MFDAIGFSVVNIAIGFVVSWLLSHYLLPVLFKVERNAKRSTTVTLVYTVAALIRNIIVYGVWVNV